MTCRALAAMVLIGVIVAGCATAIEPSRSGGPPASPQVATATADAGVAQLDDNAPSATLPTPTKTPRPKPTPLPVPSKPTGVRSDYEDEAICDDRAPEDTCAIGDTIFTVTWKAPRTNGLVIRVYGVTTCFGTDSTQTVIDGACLREHTPLPSSVRVLVAKVPASKGKVTWRMDPGEGLAATRHGVTIHSIVLAAYNADGAHSTFAIADPGDYCQSTEEACP